MLKRETRDELTKNGITIHFEGLAPTRNDVNPVCAIWAESEEPTAGEIELLGGIARELLRGHKQVGPGIAENVDMITFRKLGPERWTFRYSSQSSGPPWSPFYGGLYLFLSELKLARRNKRGAA